jgi:hypothetical protein
MTSPRETPEQKPDFLQRFRERETRAKERLAKIDGRFWYFAILGANTNIQRFTFDFAALQAVEEPPEEIELARALKDNTLFLVVGRYSRYITHELAVSRDLIKNEQGVFDLAWWMTSLLHIKTLCDVIIPCVADCSWSTIAAFSDNSRDVRLLDDVPTAAKLHPDARITIADCEWAVKHLTKYTDLLETPKFRLAVDSLTRHHLLTSDRMMAAAIWSGVEALFEINSELRFRLSAYIAACLVERGPGRKELFNSTKKLYDFRSKVGQIVGTSMLTFSRLGSCSHGY